MAGNTCANEQSIRDLLFNPNNVASYKMTFKKI